MRTGHAERRKPVETFPLLVARQYFNEGPRCNQESRRALEKRFRTSFSSALKNTVGTGLNPKCEAIKHPYVGCAIEVSHTACTKIN